MSSESRDALFERAKEENAKRKAEEAAGGGNKNYEKTDYDEIIYLGLEYDKPKLVRLLGNPKIARNGDPYSPKDVNISWIVGDNDKPFRCVWPSKEENPNWILWKIFDKVMAYKWDGSLNAGKGGRVYLNSEKHPAIFKRIDKNNKDNTLERGWYPSKFTVWNCIDRLDMKYHRENNKTKLLSKKADYNDEGKQSFPAPGIPGSVYDKIWDEIVEFYGNWEKYDVQITKKKTGPKPSDVDYGVICGSEKNKVKAEVLPYVIDSLLTDEDKKFERIDLDKMFQITSYQKILNRLKIFIQSVDAAFKTNFYTELENLAAIEKKAWDEQNANKPQEEKKEEKKESIPSTTPASEMKSSIPDEKKEESKPSARRSATPAATDYSAFKGYEKLSPSEKAAIIGIKANGKLSFIDESELIACADDKCGFESPSNFGSCPACGIKFEA